MSLRLVSSRSSSAVLLTIELALSHSHRPTLPAPAIPASLASQHPALALTHAHSHTPCSSPSPHISFAESPRPSSPFFPFFIDRTHASRDRAKPSPHPVPTSHLTHLLLLSSTSSLYSACTTTIGGRWCFPIPPDSQLCRGRANSRVPSPYRSRMHARLVLSLLPLTAPSLLDFDSP
ncbi:hypothetical protein OH77DRAFT_483647 [Trametes cingulata]|nr:hypothetical protein OH77DRAFT_483647 [Trametes cingulata]